MLFGCYSRNIRLSLSPHPPPPFSKDFLTETELICDLNTSSSKKLFFFSAEVKLVFQHSAL